MKGLLLKDTYMIMKNCRAYVFLLLVFMMSSFFVDNSFFLFYPSLIGGLIPVTLISYDEREKWNIYAATMPYSSNQIVSAKYLIGLIFEIFIFVFMSIARACHLIMTNSFELMSYISMMLVVLLVGIIGPAILLPFIFKFGSEKGRLIYYIMIGVICALFSFSAMSGEDGILTTNVNTSLLIPILVVIASLIYIVSWRLSIVFYGKREL